MMTNFEIDTEKLSFRVKDIIEEGRREELEEELSQGTVYNLLSQKSKNPHLRTVYTAGEVGRFSTEELGLSYPGLKIDVDKLAEWKEIYGLSQQDIARKCSISSSTVCRILNDDIKDNSTRLETAKKILDGTGFGKDELFSRDFIYDFENLSEKASEIITGCILGDGGIKSRKEGNNSLMFMGRDQRYVGFIQKELGDENIFGNIFLDDRGGYKLSRFQSECSPIFNKEQIYQRFYKYDPKHTHFEEIEFRKKIPKDLELSSTVAKLWYLSHGTLQRPKDRTLYVRISAETYPKREIEILQDKLEEKGFKLNKPSKRERYKGKNGEERGYTIIFSPDSTHDFFDWIGECPYTARDAISQEGFGTRMKDKWPD